jgi:hypothetical protein
MLGLIKTYWRRKAMAGIGKSNDGLPVKTDGALFTDEETITMNKELDERLCQRYPGLYRGRHNPTERTLMGRGFACGDGWYTLIDVISALLTTHDPETCAIQVKEKFGGLRFYHTSADDYTLGVEMAAGTLSSYICEICGAPGCLNDEAGWRSTRCGAHARENRDTYHLDVDRSRVADLRLGDAWSRLAAILQASAEWHTKKNGMPKAKFQMAKENSRLRIQWTGGNRMTAGMVDLITHYANRIDENTGLVVIGENKG